MDAVPGDGVAYRIQAYCYAVATVIGDDVVRADQVVVGIEVNDDPALPIGERIESAQVGAYVVTSDGVEGGIPDAYAEPIAADQVALAERTGSNGDFEFVLWGRVAGVIGGGLAGTISSQNS